MHQKSLFKDTLVSIFCFFCTRPDLSAENSFLFMSILSKRLHPTISPYILHFLRKSIFTVEMSKKPSPLGGKVLNEVKRMRGNFPQAAACLRPHQSPAVTAAPLFVTYGDISPRRGENLSLPGEAFRGKWISVGENKKKKYGS